MDEKKKAKKTVGFYVERTQMKAFRASSVLLSFAYLAAEGQTEGNSETYLGTRSLLVLDEAHNIEEECLRISPVRLI